MNYHETCPHCGRTSTAYLVNLNEPLLAAFIVFAEAWIRLGRTVKKSEIELTHSQYGNFQKLRHFGLVQKAEGQTWIMTWDGMAFLTGKASVTTPAAQFDNATCGDDHPAWATHTDPRRKVTIREVLPTAWQTRADYVAQKIGHA